MYNPTEQIAEFNKTNVANAIKLAALSIENAEKLVKLNLNAAKLALAQGVEGAQAAASVKDVQELIALRSKIAEPACRAPSATRARCTSWRPKRGGILGVRRASVVELHEGRRRVGRQGERRCAGRLGLRPSTRSSRRSPLRPPRSTSSRRRPSRS